MEKIVLEAEPRKETGKSKVHAIRKSGFIPAVVYAEGKESLPIKVSHREFYRLIHQYHVESAVINLNVKDDEKYKERVCLVKEIQHHPVSGEVIHIDFNEISLTKQIKVSVPVIVKGEPIGVKQEGGSLEQILWEIEVECLPTEIPKQFEIDAAPLKIGDSIHVKDISVQAGVKILNDPEALVVSVVAPMKEEVPEVAPEAEAAQEPEVIKEKKEVPEAGGAAKQEEPQKKEKEKKEKE